MKETAHILIVDDDAATRLVTTRIMQSAGYQTTAVAGGQECLDWLEEHKPSLVLLDVMLPDIDGFELCQRIKANPALTGVFVVHLSGVFTSSDQQVKGLESGADGYIALPVSNRELVARVQAILRHKQAVDALRDKVAVLQAMAEIGREIITATSSRDILDLVCRHAAELVRVPKSAIASRTASGDMEVAASYGLDSAELARDEFARFWQAAPARFGRLGLGRVIRVEDTLGSRHIMAEFGAREGIRSLILMPLAAGGETLAVLAVFDIVPHTWSTDELQILELLASQAAIALDKIGRLESEQRRAAHLAMLNEVGRAITSTLDLDHMLLTLLEKVREATNAEACSVALLEKSASSPAVPAGESAADNPGYLVFRQAVGGASQAVVGLRLELSQGIAGWAAARRQSALVPDVASDPRFFDRVDYDTGFVTRDIVCVPLVARGQVTGVIELINKRDSRFDEDDVRLLESLAAQAAIAIENVRLFEIERGGRQQIETLLYIGQTISSTLDVDTILGQVVGEAMRTSGATHGSALVARPELGHFERRALRGYLPEQVQQARAIPLLLERGVVGRAYRARRIARVDDVLADPDYFPLLPDTRSELAIPIIRGEQVLGAFDLQSPKTGAFCNVDHDFLQALAYQAAIALENARLFQATCRQVNELRAVSEAAMAGVSGQSFDEVIARATTTLSQVWPETNLDLMLVDETSQALRLLASYHGVPMETSATTSDSSQEIIDRAVRERQALRIGDTRGDPCYIPSVPGARSQMVAPLIVGGRALGVINVESQQLNAFSEEDLHLLTTLTGQLAMIFEKTRLDAALEAEHDLLARRVTERTAELSAANAELAKAARLKDEFLASMSHELRTPLNAVLAMAEGLQEQLFGDLNEKQSKMVQTIEESGRHLLALINDILDLSKIEAGKVELETAPVVVSLVCQASLQFVRQAAHEKQIELTLSLDSQTATVEADERRLKQILVNLLSNAVKFTPAGGRVGLEVKGDAEQGVLRLCVWDTGIGIAPEDVARLFQPFVQLDSRLSRQYSGTGLGLSLVRRLVDLHGGSVGVESAVGKGSRFTVSLPWCEAEGGRQSASCEDEGKPESALISHTPALILLVEDNEANIAATSAYLQAKGYRVILARNGHEAVQAAEEERPDVIVMDIQMPGLDGMEAIRRIRTLPPPAPSLGERTEGGGAIIALTALAMPGDRERCLAAGADEYLSKPASLKGLIAAIENGLASSRQAKEK